MHNKIKNIIWKIGSENDQKKIDCLAEMICELIKESECPEKYMDKLYILCHGYHFNEEKLMESGVKMKWTVEESIRLFESQGIYFRDEYSGVTEYDKCYVINMLYSDYYPLISDSSTAVKFAEKYIKDEDYPIKGGKAFAEWSFRHKHEMKMKHDPSMIKMK